MTAITDFVASHRAFFYFHKDQDGERMRQKSGLLTARIMIAIAAVIFLTSNVQAQTPFEETLQQLNSMNVRNYLQPFVNTIGANLNSGFYHTAEIGDLGFYFQFQIVGMGTIIGDAEKVCTGLPPQSPGYSHNPVQTASVFGDKGTIIQGPAPGLSYQFQNGQFNTSFMPFGTPQVTIGNLFGTQAVVRFIQIPEMGNIPRSTLAGGGIRHSLNKYFPVLPINVTAGLFYQKFTFGDYVSATATAFGFQGSKSFSIATVYGGLQYESSTTSLDYVFKGQPVSKVSLDLSATNTIRATIGLNLNFALVNLNGDISVGNVTAVSAGIGFGM